MTLSPTLISLRNLDKFPNFGAVCRQAFGEHFNKTREGIEGLFLFIHSNDSAPGIEPPGIRVHQRAIVQGNTSRDTVSRCARSDPMTVISLKVDNFHISFKRWFSSFPVFVLLPGYAVIPPCPRFWSPASNWAVARPHSGQRAAVFSLMRSLAYRGNII